MTSMAAHARRIALQALQHLNKTKHLNKFVVIVDYCAGLLLSSDSSRLGLGSGLQLTHEPMSSMCILSIHVRQML